MFPSTKNAAIASNSATSSGVEPVKALKDRFSVEPAEEETYPRGDGSPLHASPTDRTKTSSGEGFLRRVWQRGVDERGWGRGAQDLGIQGRRRGALM